MSKERQSQVDISLHEIRMARWRARRESQPLTAKQQRFVEEYLIDLNGAAAARRAGYSEATAKSIAHELLHEKLHVKALVNEAIALRSEHTIEQLRQLFHRINRKRRNSI